MKKVCVILSEGFEEVEAITVIDVLRRADLMVEVLGVGDTKITGAHNVTLFCDDVFDYSIATDFDCVVLVGGMRNAIALSENQMILDALNKCYEENDVVAGICATPALVFSKCEWFDGVMATCYPSDDLVKNLGDNFVDEDVVVFGNVITSQSPATAMEFAFAIIEKLGIDSSDVKIGLKGK
jgi:4-methyl-5(b-hydroxyethyl)-thiazole monophosphate biosynthesis